MQRDFIKIDLQRNGRAGLMSAFQMISFKLLRSE
jgi:hypothetical protein